MSPAKNARVKKHMTIYDVARRSGVSAATVSRVERGKQGVSRETAQRMAKALGITEQKIIYPERFAARN